MCAFASSNLSVSSIIGWPQVRSKIGGNFLESYPAMALSGAARDPTQPNQLSAVFKGVHSSTLDPESSCGSELMVQ